MTERCFHCSSSLWPVEPQHPKTGRALCFWLIP